MCNQYTSPYFRNKYAVRLMKFLDENKLLSTRQFGFRAKMSTELAATLLLDDIRKSMDKGQLVGAVFVDLGKATLNC